MVTIKNLLDNLLLHLPFSIFADALVRHPILGYAIKRETGASPVQSRCCEFRFNAAGITTATDYVSR